MAKPKDFPDYCKSGEVHTHKMTEAEKEAFEKERAARHRKYHWRDSKNAVNDAENYTVSVIKQRDKKGGPPLMLLSGNRIRQQMASGNIVIKPFDSRHVNPNSVNLTLYHELLAYDDVTLDMKREEKAHVTAGFGDVGFCGYWTLEIFVVQPLIIYPDIEVCQIYYHDIDPDYDEYRSTKYQHNHGIQVSQLWQDFKKEV